MEVGSIPVKALPVTGMFATALFPPHLDLLSRVISAPPQASLAPRWSGMVSTLHPNENKNLFEFFCYSKFDNICPTYIETYVETRPILGYR